MGRMLLAALMMTVSLMLCTSLGFSQERVAATTDALLNNSKIRHGETLLKNFADGKSTARVIVNLSMPGRFAQISERGVRKRVFKDVGLRRELKEAIGKIQARVIGRMDPHKVRAKQTFRYVSGFSAEVTLEGLQELAQSNEVVSIEIDRILQPHLAQGISLINASVVRNSYSGAGIAIAICDTGVDYNHPKLGGGGFPNGKVIGGWDFGDGDEDPMDENGHGTRCAGIAAGDIGVMAGDYVGGVAHSAKLYALKISSGSGGSALASNVIVAWEWCITHREEDRNNPIMIVSTSFGGGKYDTVCDEEDLMTRTAANVVAAGMTLFVSSGNEGYCDSLSWPACISHVVSVGAVYDDAGFGYAPCVSSDSCATKFETGGCETDYYAVDVAAADVVPSYSNTAPFLDLFAPSNRAYTTDIAGYHASFGGTSAACPYAAGAAACLQSAAKFVTGSYLTPAEVRSSLASTGDLITDGKVDITKPRINLGSAVDAVGYLCECDLVPDTTPTVIPRGELLGFEARVTNNTDKTGCVLFGSKLTKPDETRTGWVIHPETVCLGPYESKSKHVSHTVPGSFVPGTYTYHGYVGRYGKGILHECQFEFTVTE